MTARIGHLIVGSPEHGVVRHAEAVASGGDARDPVVRAASADALHGSASLTGLSECRAVVVPFTDRLFGTGPEVAATTFARLAGRLHAHGVTVVAGLHDVPLLRAGAGADDVIRAGRLAEAYRTVVAASSGVIVSSRHEHVRLADLRTEARPVAVVPLPVPQAEHVAGVPRRTDGQPTVLGFIYPGKGHADVIEALDALPRGVGLVALGRASDGHDDLGQALERQASRAGRPFVATGFVPDDALPARLASAGVPIAPNATVSASGSIATWLGAGRRPLVADSPYARELLDRHPGSVSIYAGAVELSAAIALARAEPRRTWLTAGAARGPSVADTAALHRRVMLAMAAEATASADSGRGRRVA